jgi:enamine deaminase RidA (YjgF/YER057c/UK114 family)
MRRASLLALSRRVVLPGLFFVALLGSAARGDEPRLSISGYDPVAYFTVGQPLQGKAEFEHVWRRSRWRFANGEHRDLFIRDPHRYAPQYDGYCAFGAADQAAAHKDTVDPEAWAIVDGKLYLVRTREALGRWRERAAEHIRQADADWGAVAGLADPVIVGSPCAASSPPTNVVALRDGRRLLMIANQVPRDEAGNVVGKGDMRAQIEQVGRNVGACLQAGGATVDNIVSTTRFVAAPAEFDSYADQLPRYFGPPSPASRTVRAAQLSSPDILLEVEAVALTK